MSKKALSATQKTLQRAYYLVEGYGKEWVEFQAASQMPSEEPVRNYREYLRWVSLHMIDPGSGVVPPLLQLLADSVRTRLAESESPGEACLRLQVFLQAGPGSSALKLVELIDLCTNAQVELRSWLLAWDARDVARSGPATLTFRQATKEGLESVGLRPTNRRTLIAAKENPKKAIDLGCDPKGDHNIQAYNVQALLRLQKDREGKKVVPPKAKKSAEQ